MPEVKRCPKCGAQNAATAEWCTLCLTKFETTKPDADLAGELSALSGPVEEVIEPRIPPSGDTISGGNGDDTTAIPQTTPEPSGNGDATVPAPAAEEPEPEPVHAPAGQAFVSAPPPPMRDVPVKFLRDGDRVRWVCPACETPNEIEASACRICGTVMARLFAAPEATVQKTETKPPGTAMALSAALPGLGHHYAGATATGISRASLYVWTVVIAVLFLARPPQRAQGLLRGVGVLFALAAAAVWLVSIVEAGRFAEGDKTPLVPPRAVTWFSAGLTMLLFLGLAAAAFSRG